MSSIDTRIVEMKFDNKQFLQGISETIKALDTLEKNLGSAGGANLGNIAAGLDQAQEQANRFSLKGIVNAIDDLKNRFSVLGAIGFSAIQNITSGLVDMGKQTLATIATGGIDRALKIEEAQFKLRGLGQDVELTMDSALEAVKGTAYGLDSAVDVAASFGAAGMQAGDEMTEALRGVAGMSAMTGSSFEEIGHIFTQIAGEGKLSTLRLQQFSTRGINAAAVLAEELNVTEAELRQMVSNGEVSFDMFTEAMSDAFGDHATKANETYRGSLSNLNSAFSRIGASIHTPRLEGLRRTFNALTPVIDDVHDALGPLIDLYGDFVTATADKRVKFLEGLDLGEGSDFAGAIQNIADILRHLWETFEAIVGPIKAAWAAVFPPVASNIMTTITGAILKFVQAIKMGEGTGENIQRIFQGLFSVLSIGITIIVEIAKAIGGFFKLLFSGFGSGSGVNLGILDMVGNFGDLLMSLKEFLVEGDGIRNFFDNILYGAERVLKPTIDFFNDLGEAIGALFRGDFSGAKDLFADAFSGLDGPLEAVRSLFTDVLGHIQTWGESVYESLSGVGNSALSPFVTVLGWIIDRVSDLRNLMSGFRISFDFGAFFSTVETSGSLAMSAWEGLKSVMSTVGDFIEPVMTRLTDFLGTMTDKIMGWIEDLDFTEAVALLNTGVLIAAYLALRSFISKFSGLLDDLRGFLDSGAEALDQLTGTLKTMQNEVRAKMLLTIAIAVGILVAAMVILSQIDSAKLIPALISVGVLFTMMVGTLAIIQKVDLTGSGLIKSSAGLILMAIAVNILASAVKKIADLSWEEMARGLAGTAALLVGLTLFSKFSSADSAGLSAGAGLILMAIALQLLVGAVKRLGEMDMATLEQGIISITILLGLMAALSQAMSGTSGLFTAAAAMIVISVALYLMYGAIKLYAGMDWAEFGKGLLLIAATMAVLTVAINLFPTSGAIAGAAAILVISAALLIISGVLKVFGAMGWDEILKAGVVLAGTLALIVGALLLTQGALPGAAALLVVSAALLVLAVALQVLSALSWEGLLVALAALVGVFLVMGAAALVLGPVVPILAALAIVIAAMGVAMLLASVAVLIFATAFATMAGIGAAGVAVLVAAFEGVIMLLPLLGEQIGLALIAFAKVIEDSGPVIIAVLTVIMQALIQAVRDILPDIFGLIDDLIKGIIGLIDSNAPLVIASLGNIMRDLIQEVRNTLPEVFALIEELVWGIVDTITTLAPDVLAAVLDMLLGMLEEIANSIPDFTSAAGDIVVAFLEGIEEEIPRIKDAAVNLMETFVDTMIEALTDDTPRILGKITGMGKDMVQGLIDELLSGAGRIGDAITGMLSSAWDKGMSWLGIRSPSRKFMEMGYWSVEGLSAGFSDNTSTAEKAAEGLGESAVDALKDSLSSIASVLDGEMDMNPVIAPVVDLSNVKKGSDELSSLLNPNALNIDLERSVSRARSVQRLWDRNQKMAAELAQPTPMPEPSRTEISYTQNNTSPKALSAAEIYRQTKNQLSMIKEVSDARKG